MHLMHLAFLLDFLLFGGGDVSVAIPIIFLEVFCGETHFERHIVFIRNHEVYSPCGGKVSCRYFKFLRIFEASRRSCVFFFSPKAAPIRIGCPHFLELLF